MASLNDALKKVLLRDQIISTGDFDLAVAEQKKTGGEISRVLLRLKLITDEQLAQALSEAWHIPSLKVSSLKIDEKLVNLLPRNIIEKFQVLPISLLGDRLTLAMVDPLNIFAIDNVKTLTGYTIIPVIVTPSQIQQVIQGVSGDDTVVKEESGDVLEGIIKDMGDADDLELAQERTAHLKTSAVEELVEEAPIIRLTDAIIQQAVLAKASDVFIEPLPEALRIRYRIDGVIQEVDRMSKVLHYPIVSRVKVISNLDISEHRLPQDGRFKTVISGGREIDFRVNVLPTILGEKVCLRVLDQGATVLDLDGLGFEETSLARLKDCAVHPHGMILTCGPTGSGKTTTLYSVLNHVDSPDKNIVTVEDPVEYQIPGLNQVNIKTQVGLTFPAALRSILRQDPDIIMIGEIRDAETLDIAVKAALTGHLVLSSLHTTTAAGSIIRMMNMGIEPFLISSSVLAIIAQRLLRRICEKCKESHIIDDVTAKKVGLARFIPSGKYELFRGKGCKYCLSSGYKGRVGIHEILSLTPAVKEKILNRAGEIKIKAIAREEGMFTMREDALMKAVKGLTSLEEVLRITASDNDE